MAFRPDLAMPCIFLQGIRETLLDIGTNGSDRLRLLRLRLRLRYNNFCPFRSDHHGGKGSPVRP
jgi:hypothetical protein